MDNSNDLTSSSIMQTNGSSSDFYSGTSSGTSNNGNSFFSGLQNISITTWIIIFLILSFLGFNIFVYLAKGTQIVDSFVTPLLSSIFKLFAYVTGQVVDVTAAGTQNIVNSGAQFVDERLTKVQNNIENVQAKNSSTSLKTQPVQQNAPSNAMTDNALNKSLNTSAQENQDFQADESTSTIQSGGGKSGWCYIGEDRGFRSCVEVGQQDKCMSGDIFPSKDICVNPNLRS